MALTLLEPIIVNTAANFTFANASVTSNITAGNVKTDNLLYANGAPYIFTTSAAGSNTQVQFNDANAFAGSANFTFNKTSNTLSVTNIVSNGAGLTSLNGSNITGQVANALVAGTVYTAAQPNITSVGLLTSLSIGPNSSLIMTGTSGYVRANSIQGTDGVNAIYPSYGGVTGAAGITSNLTVGIGSAGNITANGNVTASYFIGNGSSLSGISAGNITGQVANALIAGTVYTNAQPNITSVGTLTNLNVSGNATVDGNLVVNGNLVYINVETLRVEDPIIELGGGVNGAPLTSNDNKDRGSLLHYYTTVPVDAFMGWDTSNGEFGFGSNVSVTGEVVTFNTYGNIRAGYFLGNASQLSAINASAITSGTLAQARLANSSITINGTAVSLGGSTSVSSNTTQTLTLGSYLTGTSFNGGTAVTTTVDATTTNTANKVVARDTNGSFSANIITATLSGSATTAGTVTTNAQPNITSVGTLTSLGVSGTVTANTLVSNVATGTAPLTVTSTTRVANLNVAYANVADFTNVTAPGTGTGYVIFANATTGNVAEWTSSGISSNLANNSITATTFVGTLSGAATSATTAGTVTTAAQPNITSVGTLTGVSVSGTASFSGLSTFYASQDRFSTITGATGTVTHDISNGAVFYHSTVVANFTPNFTNVPTTDNYSTVAVLFIAQGATPYMPTNTPNIQIGGSNVTVKWSGGTTPTGGVSGSIDIISYSLIRNSGSWSVLGQAGNFT